MVARVREVMSVFFQTHTQSMIEKRPLNGPTRMHVVLPNDNASRVNPVLQIDGSEAT